MSNEIVSTQAVQLPAHLQAFQGDVGETIDVDPSTPRLTLAQGQSPEVLEEAARFGDILLHAAGDTINLGQWTMVIVVGVVREYLWWEEDENGRDRIVMRCRADHLSLLPPERQRDTQWIGNDKPVASETISFACLQYDPKADAIDPNGYGPMMLSMKSTSLKVGKKLASKLRSEQAANRPYYLRAVGLKSETEKNDSGTYKVWIATLTDQWLGSEQSAMEAKGAFDEWQLIYQSYPKPGDGSASAAAPAAKAAAPTADEVAAEIKRQEAQKAEAAKPAAQVVSEADYADEAPPF